MYKKEFSGFQRMFWNKEFLKDVAAIKESGTVLQKLIIVLGKAAGFASIVLMVIGLAKFIYAYIKFYQARKAGLDERVSFADFLKTYTEGWKFFGTGCWFSIGCTLLWKIAKWMFRRTA